MEPYKACPKCQTPAVLQSARCPQCGHYFRTQFVPPDQTQMFYGAAAPQPQEFSDYRDEIRANHGLIAAMWILTVITIFLTIMAGNIVTVPAIVLDLGACGIAIALVCSRHGTDKTNGWIKIGLECAGLIFGFMAGYYRATHPY